MEEQYDIVVCGGSLAGLATAIRLNQHGLAPLVLEKSHFPRKKLCGEFLSPDSFGAFQRLGVWEAVRQEAFGPIESAMFHPLKGNPFVIPMAWLSDRTPYALALSRERLDTLLMAHARSMGVPVQEGVRVLPGISFGEKSITLKTASKSPNGNEHRANLQAMIVINATGRHGGLEKQSTRSHRASKRHVIGMKLHVQLPQPKAGDTLRMFFFPHGYGGILPMSSDTCNVCFLTSDEPAGLARQPISEVLDRTICQHPVACALLEESIPLEPFQTTANLNMTPLPWRSMRLIRVGDAMVTVDPFTGSGMSLALQTGILAADVIALGLKAGWPYDKMVRCYAERYRQCFQWRLMLLELFRPYLFSQSLQKISAPWVRPLLPVLTCIFR